MRRRLSVKWRVTLWYTGLFAALTALVLFFIYASSARMTTASIQRNLVDTVLEATDEVEYGDGGLAVDDDIEDFDGVSILVYDRGGALFHGRRPTGFAAPILPGQLQTVSAETHQWYVYDLSVEVEGYGDVVVRGIASSSAAQIARGSVGRLALIAFPFLVLIAGAGGYCITRQAFLPVKRITDTVNSISGGGDLSKRLGMTGVRDEIQTLADTFDGMFQRLEKAFLSEKRFTADASHELRTPAAVIISQCEYALSPASTDSDRVAALHTVLEAAREMSALISQLLSLARIDANRQQVELEEVNLSFLLEAVAEELTPAAGERRIALHTDIQPDLLLLADQTLLTRMLMNLLTNAIKYGRPCGDVWLSARREGDALVTHIRDNGIGIAPENLEKIWERFYRANPSRERQGGFGLGLPMVKWIAQAHDGWVDVSSTPGVGSCFTLRLPLRGREYGQDGDGDHRTRPI